MAPAPTKTKTKTAAVPEVDISPIQLLGAVLPFLVFIAALIDNLTAFHF